MTPTITLTDTPDDAAIQALAAKLILFNERGSGRPMDHRPLSLFVTHPSTGELLGGLWGASNYTQLHIELLYLPADLRGNGLGRQLILQAEQEAIARHCRGIWLDTFSFQARGFYQRLGYTEFGSIDDYPPGHTRYFFKKTLAPQPYR